MDFTDHLQRLDDSLACGICSSLFDTPLLLRTCGHSCTQLTFLFVCLFVCLKKKLTRLLTYCVNSDDANAVCSSCIRKSIEFQEKNGNAYCPTCRVGCDARDLVGNVVLRDVSERYSRVVQSLKAHAEKDRKPSKIRTRGSKLRSMEAVSDPAKKVTEISLVSQEEQDVVVMDAGDESNGDSDDSGEEYIPTQELEETTERQKQQGSVRMFMLLLCIVQHG